MPASDEYLDALIARSGIGERPPLPEWTGDFAEWEAMHDALIDWHHEYERIVAEDFAANPDAHNGNLYESVGGARSVYNDGFGGQHATKAARDAAYDRKWKLLVKRYPICSRMKDWMWERPGTAQEKRWARALATFGVNANVHDPMPVSEAQGFADRGWRRWPPVVAAMKEHLDG